MGKEILILSLSYVLLNSSKLLDCFEKLEKKTLRKRSMGKHQAEQPEVEGSVTKRPKAVGCESQ